MVVRLAAELERGLFLEGDVFRRARASVEREFAESAVRPASHAGGAYHGDPGKLRKYIDQSCLAKANGTGTRAAAAGVMVALVAPHIDPWRGAVGYGHAYGALAAAIPAEVDTFVLFGTSHAPMREPFALCRKAFATPLGDVEADLEAIDALAARGRRLRPVRRPVQPQARALARVPGRLPAPPARRGARRASSRCSPGWAPSR